MKIVLPNFDVNENEATITDIYIEEGSFVNEGELLFKAENTKGIKEITAKEGGYIKIFCEKFGVKKVGALLGEIFPTREDYENAAGAEQKKESEDIQINATKKAIELAKYFHISIQQLCKEKEGGIVKEADVRKHVEVQKKAEVRPGREQINRYDRERVVIIGAGKGAEIAMDILMDDKDKYVVGVVDSFKKDFTSYHCPLLSCSVDDFPEKIDPHMYDTVILSLGSTLNTMKTRKELFEKYTKAGIRFTNAIASDVNIRRAVKIGVGNIIMHNCYIGTGTEIGNNNMISYGMNLGHHCTIGNHNLLGPGFTTAGCVDLGNECIVMTGVKTRSYIRIGSRSVLPVGYSVDCDIEADCIIQRDKG